MIPDAVEVIVQSLRESYADYEDYVDFKIDHAPVERIHASARGHKPILVQAYFIGFTQGTPQRGPYAPHARDIMGGQLQVGFLVQYTRRDNPQFGAHDMLLFVADLIQQIRAQSWRPTTPPQDPTHPDSTLVQDGWWIEPVMASAPIQAQMLQPGVSSQFALACSVQSTFIIAWQGRAWAPPSEPLPTLPEQEQITRVTVTDADGRTIAEAP